MASLTVGGVNIPVAISSPSWTVEDHTDRASAFDGTFRASQTGGARRDWDFQTPPVTIALAETYKAALSSPASTLCSGDILQLPTMCSPELMGGTPVRTGSGHNVVLNFKLHEVQAARVLLRYSPGDTVTGESFTRSTTARYHDIDGVVRSAAINTKRDGHYTSINGIRSILLEAAGTNLALRSQEMDDVVWIKPETTVGPNLVNGPDGTLTADAVRDTVANSSHLIGQIVAFVAGDYTVSTYVEAGTLTALQILFGGAVSGTAYANFDLNAGSVSASSGMVRTSIVSVASGRWRVSATFANTFVGNEAFYFGLLNSPTAGRATAYVGAGVGLFLWGAQIEKTAIVTSYIPTTTATVTRGADSYSFPHTQPPGESTFSAKFVESGTAVTGTAVFEITTAGVANPRIRSFSVGGLYSTSHSNATTTVSSTLAAVPPIGQVVELVSRLFGDGSVDSTQSLAGGAATASAQSAANALAAAWADDILWLNAEGTTNQGVVALQSFKIVAGSRSLSEMRGL